MFDKVLLFLHAARCGADSLSQDQDGALNQDELGDLFSTAPPGIPWRNQKFLGLDDGGAVTLQTWLARWRYVGFFTMPVKSLLSHFKYDYPVRA